MAGSHGAVITANSGRGLSVLSSTDDYRVVLPPLPAGIFAVNTVFLHCDVTGRPYRVDHFRAELERLGVMKEIAAIGAYQMNHLWMLTLHTARAKQRLVEARELSVKEKKCLVLDPDNSEVRLKVHWVPFHVPDEALFRAFERYGKVQEVTRETWRTEGFQGIQSSTRMVRLSLKQGVTIDSLPHQLKVCGGGVLVVVPGRAPLCLRCKSRGHIRKDCRAPWCQQCRRVGHAPEDCVRTYATVTGDRSTDDVQDLEMDEEEAEDTARSESQRPPPAPPTNKQENSGTSSSATGPPESNAEPEPKAQGTGILSEPVGTPVKLTEQAAETSDTPLSKERQEETEIDTDDAPLTDDFPALQTLDPFSLSPSPDRPHKVEQKWKGGLTKKGRFNPMPRIPPEDRRRQDPA